MAWLKSIFKNLIASLRVAVGSPILEEMFYISPFSDDEDDVPGTIKSEQVRGKFSLKNLTIFFPPKKDQRNCKENTNQKACKKKKLNLYISNAYVDPCVSQVLVNTDLCRSGVV